jgi:sigma-B regulation protein RsbU (phosphoserine phosphatase)
MREVGGDLYDFHRRDDDFYFIIGDVSGKSVTAAMFMSATVNLFRSAIKRLQSPKAIMEEMNSVLSDNNPRMMFVTAFIGRLHIPTGELLFCNAGHLSPLKVHSEKTGQKVDSIEMEPNIPLGYDGGFRYKEQGTMLGKGDILVLYTDGVTEASDEKQCFYETDRLLDALNACGAANPDALLEGVKRDIQDFAGQAEQADDLTMLCIQYRGTGMEHNTNT